ncbi:MAG TPA: hypothetical protein VEU50_15540 [Archangium sp.]|nr:hypothetical protein [Archangium sp.]
MQQGTRPASGAREVMLPYFSGRMGFSGHTVNPVNASRLEPTSAAPIGVQSTIPGLNSLTFTATRPRPSAPTAR